MVAVSVTASTGIAACNIGGTTLHSFAGIGLGREKVDVLLQRVMANNKVQRRWHVTKVLIIDELSLIEASCWTKLRKLPGQSEGSTSLGEAPRRYLQVTFFSCRLWTRRELPSLRLRQSRGTGRCKSRWIFRRFIDRKTKVFATYQSICWCLL